MNYLMMDSNSVHGVY